METWQPKTSNAPARPVFAPAAKPDAEGVVQGAPEAVPVRLSDEPKPRGGVPAQMKKSPVFISLDGVPFYD